MKKKLYLLLIISYVFLIVPTLLYLVWLVPQLNSEYNTLLASGGVIGGSGLYGASKIPDTVKYSGLFKSASKCYTMLIVSILVKDFYIEIVGLVAVLFSSYLVYKLLKGFYYDRKRKFENKQLASEIASSLNENTK